MPSPSPLARVGLALLALAGAASAQNNKLATTPANFRGFYILDNGAVSTVTCSSTATFFTSSTYGACCDSDNCNFATACVSGTASRIFGGTFTCDSAFPDCYTMTVYASYPSADQSWLVRGCATNWRAFTIYREIVTSTSASTTSKTASQANSPTITGATATPTGNGDGDGGSGQITDPPTGLPNPTGTPQPIVEGGSKAWIAGAVIGPLLGLALIGLVAFWLLRRRRVANENHNVGMAASDAKPAPSVADRSSMHPSVYYGAGSPGVAPANSPAPGKYYQGEPPSAVASTPSPANGYANTSPYQQQAAFGAAPYPPQQGQYPPQQGQYGQYSPNPSQYSPQPYPAQYSPPPQAMMNQYPGPQHTAELASGPMAPPPQELGDGAPFRK